MTDIPERMKHLRLDARGYPIPFIVFVDREGKPHFTVNNDELIFRCAKEDLCGICGTKLFRGRWFTGGPRSAFHDHGAYNDPPMHHECMRYAMQVCPYISMNRYRGRIDGGTLKNAVLVDNTMMPGRPAMFVSVMSIGTKVSYNGPMTRFKPNRPYRQVEYWRGGQLLSNEEGEEIVKQEMAKELPELQSPKFIVR